MNIELSEIYYRLGFLNQFKNKNYDLAKWYYQKAVSHNPKLMEALYNLAIIYKEYFQNYKGSIIYYNRIIDLEPDNDEAIYERGKCFGLIKEYHNEIEDYTLCIEINPKFEHYTSRMIAYNNAFEYESALDDGLTFIDYSNNSIWYRAMGNAYLGMAKQIKREEEGYPSHYF